MKRYNSVYEGVYTKPNEMVEEPHGDWVRWEDVEALLKSHTELKTALEYAQTIYGLFGAVINEPYNPGTWYDVATRAIENAEEMQRKCRGNAEEVML